MNYIQPSGKSLPDPNGSLSNDLPPCVIRYVNEAWAQAEKERTKHHGPYNKNSPQLLAAIGKRASVY